MTERQKDYWWLVVALLPFWAIPLGVLLVASDFAPGTFFVGMGASASVGCVRLLNEFWRHGIHNDR